MIHHVAVELVISERIINERLHCKDVCRHQTRLLEKTLDTVYETAGTMKGFAFLRVLGRRPLYGQDRYSRELVWLIESLLWFVVDHDAAVPRESSSAIFEAQKPRNELQVSIVT